MAQVASGQLHGDPTLARVMTGLLFGVTAHDPLVFVCAPLLMTAVAFVAVWLPARRACRVNPVVALRAE